MEGEEDGRAGRRLNGRLYFICTLSNIEFVGEKRRNSEYMSPPPQLDLRARVRYIFPEKGTGLKWFSRRFNVGDDKHLPASAS